MKYINWGLILYAFSDLALDIYSINKMDVVTPDLAKLYFWCFAPTVICFFRNLYEGKTFLRTLKDISNYTSTFEPWNSHPEVPFKAMTLISENMGMLGFSILIYRMSGQNITYMQNFCLIQSGVSIMTYRYHNRKHLFVAVLFITACMTYA